MAKIDSYTTVQNAEDDFSSTTRQPEHQDPLQTSEVKWTASSLLIIRNPRGGL